MERIVGIDWATKTHQIEVQAEDGTVVCNDSYPADLSEVYGLRDELLAMVDKPHQLKVGIEDPTRTIVRVLLDAGMEVFILTPRKVSAVRALYSEAETKTDQLDAHIICDELRVHREVFYKLVPNPPVVTALSRYYRALEDAKSDVTRFSNRLRHKLTGFFPQFLELEWELTSRVMLDLLELIASPSAVEQVSVERVDQVLGRCRKHSAQEVLEILAAEPVPLGERIVDTDGEVASVQVDQLRASVEAEQTWERPITELLEEISRQQKRGELPSARCDVAEDGHKEVKPSKDTHDDSDQERVSDIEIALSTDGVGVRTVAGLFAEGFQALAGLDRQMLRRQSIAPVTEQTGQQSSSDQGPDPFVHRRYARNRHLNDTMHQLGDSLQRRNSHYRARYVKMREKNHTHGRACRQLADQYLRVLFAMLRDRTTYDSDLHGATRR